VSWALIHHKIIVYSVDKIECSSHHFFLCRLNGNDFSGPIGSVAGLSNLKYLDLSSNDMTGSLIDTGNLTKLESFKVNGNKLSGTVPKAFSNMPLLGMFPCKYENTLPFIL